MEGRPQRQAPRVAGGQLTGKGWGKVTPRLDPANRSEQQRQQRQQRRQHEQIGVNISKYRQKPKRSSFFPFCATPSNTAMRGESAESAKTNATLPTSPRLKDSANEDIAKSGGIATTATRTFVADDEMRPHVQISGVSSLLTSNKGSENSSGRTSEKNNQAGTGSLNGGFASSSSLSGRGWTPFDSPPRESSGVRELQRRKCEFKVYVVFRGGWCTSSHSLLRGFAGLNQSIRMAGGKVVALSSQTPDQVARAARDLKLPFQVFGDPTNAHVKEMNRRFKMGCTITQNEMVKDAYPQGMAQPCVMAIHVDPAQDESSVLYKWIRFQTIGSLRHNDAWASILKALSLKNSPLPFSPPPPRPPLTTAAGAMVAAGRAAASSPTALPPASCDVSTPLTTRILRRPQASLRMRATSIDSVEVDEGGRIVNLYDPETRQQQRQQARATRRLRSSDDSPREGEQSAAVTAAETGEMGSFPTAGTTAAAASARAQAMSRRHRRATLGETPPRTSRHATPARSVSIDEAVEEALEEAKRRFNGSGGARAATTDSMTPSRWGSGATFGTAVPMVRASRSHEMTTVTATAKTPVLRYRGDEATPVRCGEKTPVARHTGGDTVTVPPRNSDGAFAREREDDVNLAKGESGGEVSRFWSAPFPVKETLTPAEGEDDRNGSAPTTGVTFRGSHTDAPPHGGVPIPRRGESPRAEGGVEGGVAPSRERTPPTGRRRVPPPSYDDVSRARRAGRLGVGGIVGVSRTYSDEAQHQRQETGIEKRNGQQQQQQVAIPALILPPQHRRPGSGTKRVESGREVAARVVATAAGGAVPAKPQKKLTQRRLWSFSGRSSTFDEAVAEFDSCSNRRVNGGNRNCKNPSNGGEMSDGGGGVAENGVGDAAAVGGGATGGGESAPACVLDAVPSGRWSFIKRARGREKQNTHPHTKPAAAAAAAVSAPS